MTEIKEDLHWSEKTIASSFFNKILWFCLSKAFCRSLRSLRSFQLVNLRQNFLETDQLRMIDTFCQVIYSE